MSIDIENLKSQWKIGFPKPILTDVKLKQSKMHIISFSEPGIVYNKKSYKVNNPGIDFIGIRDNHLVFWNYCKANRIDYFKNF